MGKLLESNVRKSMSPVTTLRPHLVSMDHGRMRQSVSPVSLNSNSSNFTRFLASFSRKFIFSAQNVHLLPAVFNRTPTFVKTTGSEKLKSFHPNFNFSKQVFNFHGNFRLFFCQISFQSLQLHFPFTQFRLHYSNSTFLYPTFHFPT